MPLGPGEHTPPAVSTKAIPAPSARWAHDGVRELRELVGDGREQRSIGYEASLLGDGDVGSDRRDATRTRCAPRSCPRVPPRRSRGDSCRPAPGPRRWRRGDPSCSCRVPDLAARGLLRDEGGVRVVGESGLNGLEVEGREAVPAALRASPADTSVLPTAVLAPHTQNAGTSRSRVVPAASTGVWKSRAAPNPGDSPINNRRPRPLSSRLGSESGVGWRSATPAR